MVENRELVQATKNATTANQKEIKLKIVTELEVVEGAPVGTKTSTPAKVLQ